MSDSSLDCKIYQSIHDVPTDHWDSIALKHSITYSSDFWKLLEDSNISGISEFHYILLYDNDTPNGPDTPICIASCYTYRVDLGLFIGSLFGKLLCLVRSIFPNFLQISILECGLPLNIHSPPFLIAGSNKKDEAADLILKSISRLAQSRKTSFIGVKDLNDSLADDKKFTDLLRKNRFTLFESEPNSSINVNWESVEHYRNGMKSYYRSKLDKHLRINLKRKIHTEVVDDFSEKADLLVKQWLTVFQKAGGIKRELLNTDFFRLFSTVFKEKSKTILFYENKKLMGHALVLVDKDILRWLYTGKEQPANDSLYMYILYKVIELGIDLGVTNVQFGPTTYSIKQDFGAVLDYMHYAFRINKPLSLFISANLIKSFVEFDPPQNKDIFKSDKQ